MSVPKWSLNAPIDLLSNLTIMQYGTFFKCIVSPIIIDIRLKTQVSFSSIYFRKMTKAKACLFVEMKINIRFKEAILNRLE